MSTILFVNRITQKNKTFIAESISDIYMFFDVKSNLNVWNMEIEINWQENMNIKQVTQQNCALNVILNAIDV